MAIIWLCCCDEVVEGVEEGEEVQEVFSMNNLQAPLATEEDVEGAFEEEPEPESEQTSGGQEVAAILGRQAEDQSLPSSELSTPQEQQQFLRVSKGTVGVGGGGKKGGVLETNV